MLTFASDRTLLSGGRWHKKRFPSDRNCMDRSKKNSACFELCSCRLESIVVAVIQKLYLGVSSETAPTTAPKKRYSAVETASGQQPLIRLECCHNHAFVATFGPNLHLL